MLYLSCGMEPECGDGAEEREEDAVAEWDVGPVFCDHLRGPDADDAKLLGR